MKKLLLAIVIAILSSFIFSGATFADDQYQLGEASFSVTQYLTLPDTYDENNNVVVNQGQSYFKDENNSPLVSVILRIITFAIKIIGPVAILIIIIAGMFMLIANGESQKIDQAKEQITYAILGLAVAFLSYIIVTFIQSIFAFNT